MRVGTRIKELCAALEGMGSATAAETHRAAFPDLDVNSVRTYCSRSVGLGFATVGRSTYPMRFTIAEVRKRQSETMLAFSTGKDAVRRELEPVWAADTRRKIQEMGLWPKGLPAPDD